MAMTGGTVDINGSLVPAGEASVSIENRALRYGDGCFEAIRTIDGKPVHWDLHWQRLSATCKFLAIHLEGNSKYWFQKVIRLLEANGLDKGARIRLQVYRDGGGRYLPVSNQSAYFMEAAFLPDNGFPFHKQGLKLGRVERVRVADATMGNYKLCAQPVQVMAAMEASEKGFDNALVLTSTGKVCEAIGCNVFGLKGNTLITPSLETGCLHGTMRQRVLQLAGGFGMETKEGTYGPEEFTNADEIFLTNAILGVQWVASYEKHRYFHKKAVEFQKALNS